MTILDILKHELHWLSNHFAETPETSPFSNTVCVRVTIHGHHPNQDPADGGNRGKLINLPDSIEELLKLAGIQKNSILPLHYICIQRHDKEPKQPLLKPKDSRSWTKISSINLG